MSEVGSSVGGSRTIGTTRVFEPLADGSKRLLVAFSSEDITGFWSYFYEKQRIQYAMRNRNKAIPDYLRTGGIPVHLKSEAIKLFILNLLRR